MFVVSTDQLYITYYNLLLKWLKPQFCDALFHLDDAAIAVSRDHKPDQSDERQRIEDAGGFVMWAGISTLDLFIVLMLHLPFFSTLNTKSLIYKNAKILLAEIL